MSLDLAHLELLIALGTTGNLGRAADLVAISPSAASHRMREAERRLGIPLTETVGRSVTLTPAARHLADVAVTARASLRTAEEAARWMTSASRPAVRIALDFYDTAPWFESLTAREDLPTDVDFLRVGYDDAATAVARGRVDVGVLVVPASQPVRGRVLGEDELAGVVRDDHPAAARGELVPDDIAVSTYATGGDRPAHGFEYHEFFEPAGVQPNRLRKVESLALVLRLLRRYGGITVQPRLALDRTVLAGLATVPLHGVRIPVRYEAVVSPEPPSDVVGTLDVIEDELGRARLLT